MNLKIDNPRELPGYKKKSMLLNYNNGEIWFEHLDGMYEHSALVLEKLAEDRKKIVRPSNPAIIGFVTNETVMTSEIVKSIVDVLINSSKEFRRVCFIGSDKKTKKVLKNILSGRSFALAFINDFEKAKEWLI